MEHKVKAFKFSQYVRSDEMPLPLFKVSLNVRHWHRGHLSRFITLVVALSRVHSRRTEQN